MRKKTRKSRDMERVERGKCACEGNIEDIED